MKEYISTILIISVIGGIVSSLVSESNNNIKKYINFIVGLICAIVLLSPVVSIVNNATAIKNGIESITEKINGDEKFTKDQIINTSKENIEKGIKNEVVNHFQFSPNDVEVILDVMNDDGASLIIKSVTIVLSNKASWYDDTKIKSYMSELIGYDIIIKKR